MTDLMHPALASGGLAVITGGAGGIGRAVARRLTTMGLRVCIIDREVPADCDGAAAFAVDVSDRVAMERLAGDIGERHGPVAVLVNNAGVGGGGDALSNPEGWSRVLGVNLFGVLHGVQAFVPAMIESERPGLVINTGSKQGITAPPGDTAYNVSKAAVKTLTEGLAHTLRETTGGRISAHLLIPGFTYTGMTARRLPEAPPAAWTSEQVADRLFEGVARGEFYILCPDNETPRAVDERRILWAAGDIVENRPALSRWHPDWKDAFARFMSEEA